MEIIFFFEELPEFELSTGISKWIEETVQNENKITGDLNVVFCSDEYLLNLNIEHLNHNYYTDIITFDYSEENIVSGDLFISKDRVEDNAKAFNESFENELNRVIIHGVLHLIGYNDKSGAEKKEMKEKENFYLDRLV